MQRKAGLLWASVLSLLSSPHRAQDLGLRGPLPPSQAQCVSPLESLSSQKEAAAASCAKWRELRYLSPFTARLLITASPMRRSIPTIHQHFAFVRGSWAFTRLGGVITRRRQLGWLLDTKRFLSGQGDIQVTGKRMGHRTSTARGKDSEKHRNSFCEIRRN